MTSFNLLVLIFLLIVIILFVVYIFRMFYNHIMFNNLTDFDAGLCILAFVILIAIFSFLYINLDPNMDKQNLNIKNNQNVYLYMPKDELNY